MDADVVVVGGGPAGSATAAFLGRQGHRVVLLEKERFPRFHIGESLLPMALPVLEALDIDLAAGGHQFKSGASFRDETTGQLGSYPFKFGLEGPPRHAYHVDRSVFDLEILNAARAAGVEVREGVAVSNIEVGDDGVALETSGGGVRARFLVDASGQKALMARKLRSVTPLQYLGRAAAFFHYEGLSDAAWGEIQPDGNIEILRVDGGWAWIIPLEGRRISVGVVSRQGRMTPQDVRDLVHGSPLLRRWTDGAQQSEPQLIGDYSFVNSQPHGARYACVGDAASFLDPVFSSGVTLALIGAQNLAQSLGPALAGGNESDPTLMDPLGQRMKVAYRAFYSLIYRFYHTAIMDNLFMADASNPIYRAGLISVLAGDVWRTDNPFQDMLMASTRHKHDAAFD
jgi:flavin-dependent dehydrogenase